MTSSRIERKAVNIEETNYNQVIEEGTRLTRPSSPTVPSGLMVSGPSPSETIDTLVNVRASLPNQHTLVDYSLYLRDKSSHM